MYICRYMYAHHRVIVIYHVVTEFSKHMVSVYLHTYSYNSIHIEETTRSNHLVGCTWNVDASRWSRPCLLRQRSPTSEPWLRFGCVDRVKIGGNTDNAGDIWARGKRYCEPKIAKVGDLLLQLLWTHLSLQIASQLHQSAVTWWSVTCCAAAACGISSWITSRRTCSHCTHKPW